MISRSSWMILGSIGWAGISTLISENKVFRELALETNQTRFMMDDSIHILLIEDDPAHAELIQRAFEDRGDGTQLVVVHTLEQARAHLKNSQPVLIIADWRLPDGDSSTLLVEEHPNASAPPVVIMTSYGSERMAVE